MSCVENESKTSNNPSNIVKTDEKIVNLIAAKLMSENIELAKSPYTDEVVFFVPTKMLKIYSNDPNITKCGFGCSFRHYTETYLALNNFKNMILSIKIDLILVRFLQNTHVISQTLLKWVEARFAKGIKVSGNRAFESARKKWKTRSKLSTKRRSFFKCNHSSCLLIFN